MAQMHTLIINGQAYTLVDAAAARIDDSALGENAWSSRQIVNRLCPSFAQSGSEVVCTPVAGHPLRVVSHIEPVQAGSGDPGPENVRAISGFEQVVLTVSNDGEESNEFTLNLGQTVYGGSLDWHTGLLTVTHEYIQLTSAIPNIQLYSTGGIQFRNVLSQGGSHDSGICSHSPVRSDWASTYTIWLGSNGNTNIYWLDILTQLGLSTVDEFKAWLDTQNVQVCHKLPTPVAVQLTPQEILALAGTNTVSGNTGDTDVSGKADPDAVIRDLYSKIQALSATALPEA